MNLRFNLFIFIILLFQLSVYAQAPTSTTTLDNEKLSFTSSSAFTTSSSNISGTSGLTLDGGNSLFSRSINFKNAGEIRGVINGEGN
ncbi:MAG: hypothetical protein AB8G22_03600 [Saprospiraceae bacterium]